MAVKITMVADAATEIPSAAIRAARKVPVQDRMQARGPAVERGASVSRSVDDSGSTVLPRYDSLGTKLRK
jgi:hypothetical protein